MAKWDDESFNCNTPPKDIMCATCKYKTANITVCGETRERYTLDYCNKYKMKPHDVLWGKTPCPFYERE